MATDRCELRVWLPRQLVDAIGEVGEELHQSRAETVEQLLGSGLRHYEEAKDPALPASASAPMEFGQGAGARWE